MKKGTLRWIILLMVVATLGLIAVQWYWLQSLLEANHKQFGSAVNKSFQVLNNHLEKKRLKMLILDELPPKPVNITVVTTQTSSGVNQTTVINNFRQKKLPPATPLPPNMEWNVKKAENGRGFEFNFQFDSLIENQYDLSVLFEEAWNDEMACNCPDDDRKRILKWEVDEKIRVAHQYLDSIQQIKEEDFHKLNNLYARRFPHQVDPREMKIWDTHNDEIWHKKYDSLASRIQHIQMKLDSVQNFAEADLDLALEKTKIFQTAFDEIISPKNRIKMAIDTAEVDSLLKEVLATQGIHLAYDLQIDTHKNLSKEKHTYFASLLPFDGSSFLTIRFPDQDRFVFSKAWAAIALSVLLTLIVIFSFSYSLKVILKQKKLSDIKNDFINNMTHEFKTPITTISLATEALQDQALMFDESTRHRYLQIIANENKRMGTHVEKVLKTALLEKNDFKLHIESLDIHEIIVEAAATIGVQVENRGGMIHFNLHAHNPHLDGDRNHMIMAIRNVLDNANKYSMDTPNITILSRNTPSGLEIKITDEGIGMTKNELNKVFDKFYRVPTGNIHNVKGFGLGLTYVKKIVEEHSGAITIWSEPKKGSCFTLTFPQ